MKLLVSAVFFFLLFSFRLVFCLSHIFRQRPNPKCQTCDMEVQAMISIAAQGEGDRSGLSPRSQAVEIFKRATQDITGIQSDCVPCRPWGVDLVDQL